MVDLLGRYTDQLRWLSEFGLLPIHLMLIGHMYIAAMTAGCLVLTAHMCVAAHHLKMKHNAVEA